MIKLISFDVFIRGGRRRAHTLQDHCGRHHLILMEFICDDRLDLTVTQSLVLTHSARLCTEEMCPGAAVNTNTVAMTAEGVTLTSSSSSSSSLSGCNYRAEQLMFKYTADVSVV